MVNINKSTKVAFILLNLIITSSLFIPPLFDQKLQHTSYPLLAFPFACFVFSSLLLSCHFFVRVLKNNSLNELIQFRLQIPIDKKRLLISLILPVAFFFLYLVVGVIMLGNTEVPDSPKLDLFGADVKDWINLDYLHDGYKPAHSNILLIVQPLESLLSFLPLPRFVEAVALNSLFSSASIFLASILFYQITQKYLYTFLLTLLLGLTTSHLVFGSVPESYTLGTCSLITTYILFWFCLKNKKMNLGLWVLAGIFSFGITITNFVQTLICFVVILLYIKNIYPHKKLSKNYILIALEYIGVVISCSIFLSIIQNKLYGSDYFFMPNTIVYEAKSFITKINLLTHPLLVIEEIIKHFFLVNFVASHPSIINSYLYPGLRQLSFFGIPLSYSSIGFIAVLLWSYIFVTGTYKNVISCVSEKDKEKIIFLGTVSVSIVYNMIFHSFYGTVEMFIYTCYFTFLVAILFINNEVLKKPFFTVALGILVSLMAINNLAVLLSFKGYVFV